MYNRGPLTSLTNTRASLGAPQRVTAGKYADQMESHSKRHSYAPQEMRRSSMGGGDRRLSGGARRVSAGSARQKLMHGGVPRVQSTRNDPRPLTDKAYMNESIKQLIAYLGNHGYNRRLSVKMLAAPSIRDFMNILQFLAARICPDFRWSAEKPELQVAALFKFLKYPFPISRSTVLSVGSPHTWAILLGAVMWLVELLCYQELLDQKILGMGEAIDDSSEDKVFFEYLSRAYGSYMDGSDEYKQLEDDVQQSFVAKAKQLQQETAQVDARLAQLRKEADKYGGNSDKLARLGQRKQVLIDDIAKFEDYIGKLETQKDACVSKIDEERADIRAKEDELAELGEEKERLAKVVAGQEVTATDVQRMMTQRNNLDATQRSLISQKESARKSIWELETKVTKQVTTLEELLATYNQAARRVRLVPVQNKYADQGVSYAMELDINATSEAAMLGIDVKNELRPAFDRLKEAMQSAAAGKHEKLAALREKLDGIDEVLSDLGDDVMMLEAQVKKVEHTYALEKQARSEEIRRQASKAESIQTQASKIKLTAQEHVNAAQEALDILEMEAEEMQKSLENERAIFNARIVDALTMLVHHKQTIADHLSDLDAFFDGFTVDE